MYKITNRLHIINNSSKSSFHLLNRLYSAFLAYPDNVFIQSESLSITYAQALKYIQRLAQSLKSQSVQPGDRVCLILERDYISLLYIYSILYLGAIYVPIDNRLPIEHIKNMLCASKPSMIISSQDMISNLPKIQEASTSLHLVDNDILAHSFPVSLNTNSFSPISNKENLACILYTSGSTGKPKGVVLKHESIYLFANWAGENYLHINKSNIASIAPAFFDLSTFDYFSSFFYASKIIFMPEKLKISPYAFTCWLIEKNISVFYTVPTQLIYWLKRGHIKKNKFPSLQNILFAGEVLSMTHLRELSNSLPGVKFSNLFGPTETNVCTYYDVVPKTLKNYTNIPIGKAVPYYETKIINNQLLVRGDGLFQGYWQENKIESELDDEGWYHTGDSVSVNSNNELTYHGRLDQIVKISGYKVDLSEIENLCLSYPEISRAHANFIEADEFKFCAVLFESKVNIDEEILHQFLKLKLPNYINLHFVIQLDEMPVLPSGKLNIVKLKKIVKSVYHEQSETSY